MYSEDATWPELHCGGADGWCLSPPGAGAAKRHIGDCCSVSHDDPVTCTVRVSYQGVFPSFSCDPYADGTSGAPWLERTRRGIAVVGVIGGIHLGGCYPWTSYSAPFDSTTLETAAKAAAGSAPARFPLTSSDGCSVGL